MDRRARSKSSRFRRFMSVHNCGQLLSSEALKAKGDFEEAQEQRNDTMRQLKNVMGDNLNSGEIDEAFFDRFVLFCYR
jgi:hypothetical protein